MASRQRAFVFRTWGGKRPRAGRRPTRPGGSGVSHRPRPEHRAAHPVHVTLRLREGLPPLRDRGLLARIHEAIRGANRSPAVGDAFRVVEFSVQNDHVHLIVEASNGDVLARGVQGLAIRLARRINGALGARGRVWGDRFHARELATPRAVRNAIVYVLMNAKKHGMQTSHGVDAFSSAPWFSGFVGRTPRTDASPVRAARTWLGALGWRRRGLVAPIERPRAPS